MTFVFRTIDPNLAVKKWRAELREDMKTRDQEDKLLDSKRRKDKRIKEKEKYKRQRDEEVDDEEDDFSGSDKDTINVKRSKVYFDSDSDGETKNKVALKTDAISLAEQEELALKLLSSMHS